MEIAFNREMDFVYGEPKEVAPGIVRVVADARGQRRGGALAEPRLRHDMFQRRVAQRLAVVADLQSTPAVQAARFPDAVVQRGCAVGGQRAQEQAAQRGTQAGPVRP